MSRATMTKNNEEEKLQSKIRSRVGISNEITNCFAPNRTKNNHVLFFSCCYSPVICGKMGDGFVIFCVLSEGIVRIRETFMCLCEFYACIKFWRNSVWQTFFVCFIFGDKWFNGFPFYDLFIALLWIFAASYVALHTHTHTQIQILNEKDIFGFSKKGKTEQKYCHSWKIHSYIGTKKRKNQKEKKITTWK